MKTIAQGDILQVLRLAPGESQSAKTMVHERQVGDTRTRWVFAMLQAWGATAILGDLMAEAHDKPPPPPVQATDLVVRVCEVVDAAWNEMRHRGWIVDAGPLDE